MCALLGMCVRLWYFPNVKKIDVLADDETKHVLLSIFHALYMCLTVKDLHIRNQREGEKIENGSCVSTI